MVDKRFQYWLLKAQRVKGQSLVMSKITLFCSGFWYYPHFVEISVFRGYYPHFVDISTFCGYYPHSVEISTFRGYYPHFVDTIRNGHITSYPAHSVYHILHIFVLVMDVICIGHITNYLAHNVYHIIHIYLFSVNYWCNYNN